MPTQFIPNEPASRIFETDAGIEVRYLDKPVSLREGYVIMIKLSSAQDGQAVLFQDFLPGIHLSLQSHWHESDGIEVLRHHWRGAENLIARLIEDSTNETLALALPKAFCVASRAAPVYLPSGPMRLQWQ
jgi:hypothetical protein